MKTLCAVLAALIAAVANAADPISPLSLIPPFTDVNSEGDRTLQDWNWGGMTEIKDNYLRLTTDRANRRGFVWGKNPVSLDKFTTTLRFRVSGQGKILFGDGFAFWVTQDEYHKDGNVHGYTDKFTGFGIVFDTFVNRESAGTHKDISLVTNDGTRSVESPHGGALIANDDPGCSGDFRYYEKRADFKASESKSVAKITVDATQYPATVTVSLDAKNTGEFKTCIDKAPLHGLPDGWHRSARIGVTSSTGQLADNHDVISLMTAEGDELLPEKPGGNMLPAQVSTGTQVVDTAIRSAVQREGSRLEARLDSMTHEMEHHLHAVYERLENTVGKLKSQEQDLERRLRELEERLADKVTDRVAGQVEQKVDERVDQKVRDGVSEQVAQHVERGIQDKTGDIERRLQSQIDRHQQTTQQQASINSQDLSRKINSLTDQLKQTAQEEASKALQGQGGMFMWGAIALLLVGVAVSIWLSCRGGSSMGKGGRRYTSAGGLPGLGSAVKTKPV